MYSRRLVVSLLSCAVVAALAATWFLRDTPLELAGACGIVRADALSVFFALLTVCLALVELTSSQASSPVRLAIVAGLLVAAYLSGNVAIIAALFVLAGGVRVIGQPLSIVLSVIPALICLVLGLVGLGLQAGEWRYAASDAGAGLNSMAFVALLFAALLGSGVCALADGRDEAPMSRLDRMLGPALLYPLLRLDNLGPWNLSWLVATLLAGCTIALWAGWRAATDTPQRASVWLPRYLLGLALVGAGLGSGAGLVLASYALLTLPLIVFGVHMAVGQAHPWPLWMLSAAAPFGAPFVVAWSGVAAAQAGHVPALGVALWAAALLATVPLARLAAAGHGTPWWPQDHRLLLAAGLSAAFGIGSPILLNFLVSPIISQLAGGLSPMGEIALWPWAGLIARDSAHQPMAALPNLAMVSLMIILAALVWIGVRLLARQSSEG